MQQSDILIAVFSYNRPRELSVCLNSIFRHTDCRLIVFDDRRTNNQVAKVLASYGVEFVDGKGGQNRLGGLYQNMNDALKIARLRGYRYLVTIQDDMQFVRPMNSTVLDEYAAIFAANSYITQIDPRFVREDGSQVRRCVGAPAFEWIDTYPQTYADVGVFSIDRLTALEWQFTDNERSNRERARQLGMVRVYPFTPVTMHVPFPSSFRKRELNRARFLLRPGTYKYREMSLEDQHAMDTRAPHMPPVFRKFLQLEGFGFIERLYFSLLPDNKFFL